MNELLVSIIQKRTKEEFRSAFALSFPKYMEMSLSLSYFAQAIVPTPVIERLTREAICEMEADFRDKGMAAFGAVARDQALFTVWTLRKIHDLLTQISTAKPEKAKQKDDQKYCLHFAASALQAHFSLDCLKMALRLDQPIYPEVMEQLTDGLRAMVNAYTWARMGLDLRAPTDAVPQEPDSSDDEDMELLAASMRDMALMGDDESL
ncbi:MAG: hypothetical protein WBQ08_00585 [Candidatus Sulfotelmatobacter sp.]